MATTKFVPRPVPVEASPNLRSYLDDQIRRLAILVNDSVQQEDVSGLSIAGEQIDSGTISDLRLSSNVPFLDADNTFTDHMRLNGGVLIMTRSVPTLRLIQDPATLNESTWDFRTNNDELQLLMREDDLTVGDVVLRITRNGPSVESFIFASSMPVLLPSTNQELRFGSGNELQIFSDGTHGSYNTTGLHRFYTDSAERFRISGGDVLSWGPIKILQRSTAQSDNTSFGQIWVKSTNPQELWFTDDDGVDHQIAFV